MYFKFYSMVALAQIVSALQMPEYNAQEQSPAPSVAIFASTGAETEATTSATASAATNDGFLGNIGDQGISTADPCIVFDNHWECVSSPAGCMYRDTAHECTKT